MDNYLQYLYWVATKYADSTKGFHTQIEAIIYFDGIREEAVLWDYSEHEDGVMIKTKY